MNMEAGYKVLILLLLVFISTGIKLTVNEQNHKKTVYHSRHSNLYHGRSFKSHKEEAFVDQVIDDNKNMIDRFNNLNKKLLKSAGGSGDSQVMGGHSYSMAENKFIEFTLEQFTQLFTGVKPPQSHHRHYAWKQQQRHKRIHQDKRVIHNLLRNIDPSLVHMDEDIQSHYEQVILHNRQTHVDQNQSQNNDILENHKMRQDKFLSHERYVFDDPYAIDDSFISSIYGDVNSPSNNKYNWLDEEDYTYEGDSDEDYENRQKDWQDQHWGFNMWDEGWGQTDEDNSVWQNYAKDRDDNSYNNWNYGQSDDQDYGWNDNGDQDQYNNNYNNYDNNDNSNGYDNNDNSDDWDNYDWNNNGQDNDQNQNYNDNDNDYQYEDNNNNDEQNNNWNNYNNNNNNNNNNGWNDNNGGSYNYDDNKDPGPIVNPLKPDPNKPKLNPIIPDYSVNALDPYPEDSIEVNWPQKKGTTHVKDQGTCGSCWSFSTIGVIEAFYIIKGRGYADLSEQQLVDCQKDLYGCNGGLIDYAMDWVTENGLVSEQKYPYSGLADQNCKTSSGAFKISKYKKVVGRSQMQSYLRKGPLGAYVYVQSRFQFYSKGVFDSCQSKVTNHAVVLVGFTNDYWIVRNSWGTDWGQEGHIRIKRNQNSNNACNIEQEAFAITS